MDKFIEVHNLEEYNNAIQEKSIFLFTATWCPDCIFIKPFIGEIVDKYTQYKFYVIDRDEMIDLCKELDIMGIPSFVAFENGKETGRFVSKLRKTKEEIEQFINSL
ncbi:thioredoxin family protein [[Clostridium] spiroforme]|nr:thioredoxin family protein [Thomasclavelia spiroformis]